MIAPFIVDFICLNKNLIIELDGGQHAEAIKYDEERSTFLNLKGYKVLRFWNNDVFTKTKDVMNAIFDTLKDNGSPSPRPSPAATAID